MRRSDFDISEPSVEAHLLGRIEFSQCLELQERLVAEASARDDGQIRLLFCEHPQIITIGRGGSPAEIHYESSLIQRKQIEICWIGRGGGCLVHLPGQLAVYPIVPLAWHGLGVGEYLDRLQAGILAAIEELGFTVQTQPSGVDQSPAAVEVKNDNRGSAHGIWGRHGRLVAFGVGVENRTTYHGAFINVCPAMGLFGLIEGGRQSSLMMERRHKADMAALRAALVCRLTEAFGCQRYHVYAGHPLLRGKTVREAVRH